MIFFELPHFLHVFQCLIVSKRTTESGCCVCYEILNPNSPQNYPFFLFKWRVVLRKTTCCFNENDVLFWGKRRVVLVKTTCCFSENDVLFSVKGRERENTYPRNRNREHCIRIVKTSITPFSRAHAYTHITGVFAFLLSQVSQDYLQYAVNQISTVFFRQILTETGFKGGKHTDNVSQKSFLSLFRPQKLFDFSLKISPCVTLVTAKNQHRCWKARTCARTWDLRTKQNYILSPTPSKTKTQKNILSLFPWFFPLWGHIDPYTNREGNKKQREKKVHPTFGVMALKKAKTAEHFAYLNYHQQMYSYEQQFSISSLGIVSTQLTAWGLPHHSKCRMNLI